MKPLEALVRNFEFDSDGHAEAVRPAIEAMDRQQMRSIAQAPFIVVTNERIKTQ